jgi:hypothetical protein
MDTTFIYDQVKVATDSNIISGYLQDSLNEQLQDTVQVAYPQVERIWGMSPTWGAVIIPTTVTIIVFVLEHILNYFSMKNNKMAETKTFRKTLFEWINLVQQPVIKQIELLRDFSDAVKTNKNLQNERLAFSRNMVGKIEIVTAENIMKYLLFNSSKPKIDKRAENAFNMISQIDFLKSLETEICKQYDAYQRQSLALFSDWNNNIQQIQRLCSSSINIIEVRLMKDLIDIVYKWMEDIQNDNAVDIPKAYEKLIVPILKRCEEHVSGQANFSEVDGIKEGALALENVYKRWNSITEGFSNMFADYAEYANNALVILMASKNYFSENTEVKNWVTI